MNKADLEDIRQMVHDTGKGILGMRMYAEELVLDAEDVADGKVSRTDAGLEGEQLIARCRLLLGYCDLHNMMMSNLRRVYLGKVPLAEPLSYVDLQSIVEHAVIVFDYIGTKDWQVGVTLRRSESVVVFGREEELRLLVLNMLDNAVKYSFRPTGSDIERRVEVWLTAWQAGGASLIVRNFGNGVLSSERDQIIVAQRRGWFAIADEKPGNGLGLGEIDRIATEHRGAMVLDSRPAPKELSEGDVLTLLETDKHAAMAIPWVTTVTVRLKGLG